MTTLTENILNNMYDLARSLGAMMTTPVELVNTGVDQPDLRIGPADDLAVYVTINPNGTYSAFRLVGSQDGTGGSEDIALFTEKESWVVAVNSAFTAYYLGIAANAVAVEQEAKALRPDDGDDALLMLV